MRKILSWFPALASSALYVTSACGVSAHAHESNVFNADVSNPDLAAIVTSFEDVCLPFIMHRTDLPQSLNQQHHVKLLMQQGFEFKSRDRQDNRVIIEPARSEWRLPAIDASQINEGLKLETIISEISSRDVWVPPVYKSIIRDIDTYALREDARQTISLGWNYASQNHPGKACAVSVDTPRFSGEIFKTNFIEKDSDWKAISNSDTRWSNCTIDGSNEFEFTAELADEHVSLSVRRSDFYERRICKPKL